MGTQKCLLDGLYGSRYTISRTQLRQFVDVRQNSSDWNNYNKYLFIILFIQDIEFFNFVMLSCLISVHSVAVVAVVGALYIGLWIEFMKNTYIEFKWAASTLPGVHFTGRPPCVLGEIQQRKRTRQHRLWNASTVWVYALAEKRNSFLNITRSFFSLSFSLSVLQLHSIYILFKQADMPCLDCRWKELKSLLTFAVAPLSHARVCKETFSDGVSVCVCWCACVRRLWHQF